MVALISDNIQCSRCCCPTFSTHSGSSLMISCYKYSSTVLSHISLVGSIFMTVAISCERFVGIMFPIRCSKYVRKSWFYLLPVIFLRSIINISDETFFTDYIFCFFISIVANVTRFNEIVLYRDEEYRKLHYKLSHLRINPGYIKYYHSYFVLFFVNIIPVGKMLIKCSRRNLMSIISFDHHIKWSNHVQINERAL